MPEFAVFWVDELAGRAETVEAPSADAAEAQVRAARPGAITSVVPAQAMEGCNRTRMLWAWMETVMAPAPPAQLRSR